MSIAYKIHLLDPSDPNLPFLAGKFASLRLQALTVSGSVFSSTFAKEATYPASAWISRLQRQNIHTFVAIAYPLASTSEERTIDAGDFVGSATLLGPIPKNGYEIPLSGGPEVGEDGEESKWQLASVFNSPTHRGRGVAKMLIRAAVVFSTTATAAGGGGGGAAKLRSRIRIVIHPSNLAVRKLYLPMGFLDAGRCTLAEALVANGEGDLVPRDGGESEAGRYLVREGFVMEVVTEVSGVGSRRFGVLESLG